jgi:GMP synthase (glutamine-hydrolysing)
MSATARTVLVALHADSTDTALLQSILARRGMRVHYLRVHAGERGPDPAGVAGLAGLVVLGGAMGAYQAEEYLFLNESMRLLDSAIDRAVPAIAICLGSQLLARVAGGTALPGDAGLEWGFVSIKITSAGRADPVLGDPLLAGGGEYFSFHSDTFELPAGTDVLAESPSYPQAFRVGSTLGLQFHPELSVRGMGRLIDLVDGDAPPDEIRSARAEAKIRLEDNRRRFDSMIARWTAPTLQRSLTTHPHRNPGGQDGNTRFRR